MYNEVFAPCPECQGRAMVQVSQYVLGFGGFFIDDPETMLELTKEQLKDLREELEGEQFECHCGHTFVVYEKKGEEEKRELIKELFDC